MAAYKDLVGQKITKVTSNPGEPKTGQMWYNSTDGKLRGLGILEAWSSASPLNRSSNAGYHGSIGTSASSLALVGNPGNSSPLATEEWNGTGWSASDNMASYPSIDGNTTPHGGASGTVTSALYSGGTQYTGNTKNRAQEYNGSSWTQISNMPVNIGYNVGIGTASDTSITAGGYDASYAFLNNTLDWSGSSWTSLNTLGTARWAACGGGTESAGWFSGGRTGSYPGTNTTATEDWNGTSWSTGDALNTSRSYAAGSGPQTESIVSGGATTPGPRLGNTEVYNGTAWAETADLATARESTRGNAGTSAGAFIAGGSVPPSTNATEEFNKSTNAVTAAAWASGGALGLARNGLFGVGGPSTAGLVFGGGYPDKGNTEEYDGTSWTEQNDLNTARRGLGGFGIQTAAVAVGGITSSNSSAVEHYDGSSWTNATSLPTASNEIRCGAGTQTAGLSAGGRSGPTTFLNATYEYDGSSWTSGGNLSAGRGGIAGGCNATQTAAIAFGGYTNTPQNPVSPAVAEEYNGSSWTNGGTMVKAVLFTGGIGTQTAALSAGGGTQSPSSGFVSTCQGYDGTSWFTRPSLANPNYASGSGGTSTDGFIAGGGTSPYVATTEEFTGETTAGNVTDFTTS